MPDRLRANANRQFKNWVERPELKLLISLIPPSETPDALRQLLLAAFHAGSEAGAAAVLVDLMGAIKSRP